jgi:hypothetical protein
MSIRDSYMRLPNAIRAGINTAWQSALGTFAVTVLGFLASVQEWSGDTSRDFPSVSPLGKAIGSIFVGLVVGVLTSVFRSIKPGPQYPGAAAEAGAGEKPADRGQVGANLIWTVVAVLAVIALVIWIFGNNR